MKFLNPKKSSYQEASRRKTFLSLAFCFSVVLTTIACSRESTEFERLPPAVSVYTVKTEEIGQYHEFVARTEAHQSAELRARVEGELLQQHFHEGSFVEKDQLLFNIDPSEHQASLNQAQADLTSTVIGAENAKRNLDRSEELSESGFISPSDLDKLRTAYSQADAAVLSSTALVEKATLDLSYTKIHAPFGGKIGKVRYDVGSLVGPQSDLLATINSVDPIDVIFQVEDSRYLTFMQNTQNLSKGTTSNLSIRLPNNTLFQEPGRFNFADTKVDESMGTIRLRAEFANPTGLVIPGLFVTLVIEGDEKEPMALVPQVAVQENQQGKFVLVVDEQNNVSNRFIQLGRRIQAMWVVESGLEDGERVIVEGLQKVRPGVVVNPVDKLVDRLSGTISSVTSLE